MYNEYQWEMKYTIVYAVDPLRREKIILNSWLERSHSLRLLKGKKPSMVHYLKIHLCNKAGTRWLTKLVYSWSAKLYHTLCRHIGPMVIHQKRRGVSSLSLQNDDFTKTVIQADISTCKSHD